MAKNGFEIFDCDLHVCEPWDLWLRYIDPKFRDQAPVGPQTTGPFTDMNLIYAEQRHDAEQLDASRLPAHSAAYDEHRIMLDAAARHGRLELFTEYEQRGWGPDVQLDAMDREGIDVAVLFPSRGIPANAREYEDDRLANAVVRAYNDWLGEFCGAAPERLYGATMILPQDVEATIDEVRRTVDEYSFRAVYVRPNPVRGRNWHAPVYDRLWETCEALELVVGFHEGMPCMLPAAAADRFDGRHEDLWLTDHVIRHPVEMMYASLCMIMGGVLERFPALKVGFLEANCSWVPYWMWRMDEHFEAREATARGTLSKPPSEYFRERCYVSAEADEETAGPAIEAIGDNVLFSTDFPHQDSAFPRAVERFLAQPFSDEAKRRILWDNPRRMYGFG